MNTRQQLMQVAAGVTLALLGVDATAVETPPNHSGVIGKPFRGSDSVIAYCAMKPPVMMCETFGPQLAALSGRVA